MDYRASPALLDFARQLTASQKSHHAAAATALSYGALLTDGEQWFLNSALRVAVLSPRLLARLHAICAKVERTRP